MAAASNYSGDTADAWMRTANHNGIKMDDSMSCAEVPNPGREGFQCVIPQPWRCHALAAKMGMFPLSTCIKALSPYRLIALSPYLIQVFILFQPA